MIKNLLDKKVLCISFDGADGYVEKQRQISIITLSQWTIWSSVWKNQISYSTKK